jgi:hypothetical protein
MTTTIERILVWIQQTGTQQPTWNQRKTASDGAEEIVRPSDRQGDSVITEQVEPQEVPADDVTPGYTMPGYTVPRFRYDAATRAALQAAADRVRARITEVMGDKWPVTYWHFDVASEQMTFRRKRTIGDMADEPTEDSVDPRITQTAHAAAEEIAAILSKAHGYALDLAEPPPEPDAVEE